MPSRRDEMTRGGGPRRDAVECELRHIMMSSYVTDKMELEIIRPKLPSLLKCFFSPRSFFQAQIHPGIRNQQQWAPTLERRSEASSRRSDAL